MWITGPQVFMYGLIEGLGAFWCLVIALQGSFAGWFGRVGFVAFSIALILMPITTWNMKKNCIRTRSWLDRLGLTPTILFIVGGILFAIEYLATKPS
jgi:hypothetical protein